MKLEETMGIAAGEDVAPDDHAFRTFIRLSTGAERLARMNDRLFVDVGVGVGVRRLHDVEITVDRVP